MMHPSLGWILVGLVCLCSGVQHSTSTRLLKKSKKCSRKKVVIGISTGHVGTTTVSDPSNYINGACSLDDFKFHFEKGGKMAGIEDLKDWYDNKIIGNSTQKAESCLVRRMKDEWYQNDKTHVMLSHDTLHYYRGILDEIPAQDLLFVRIRRDDDEFIESWTPRNLTYEAHRFCYLPYSHEDDTIIKVKRGKWENMAREEKAQWFADEVEARWLKLRSDYPQVRTVEVNWAKKKPGSFVNMIEVIADALGLESKESIKDEKVHTHTAPNDDYVPPSVSIAAYNTVAGVCV